MFSKIKIILFTMLLSLSFFSGCSSEDSASGSSVSSSLSGVAQKGAFLKDSNVSLCRLDEKMVCTDDLLEVKVSDDKGSYEFKTLPWSGLSRLSISGYYFDEATGTTSLSPATITAIVDIKSNTKQKSNTNILTDIRAKRMKKLVDDDKSLEEAKEESKEDVKKLFNITSDDFTELDLVDFSEGKASVNAELLRISAAIANSSDPIGDLEELMKIYNDGGFSAVLNSPLYKKLMDEMQKVDVKEVLNVMGVESEITDAISISDIKINPFVRARISTQNSAQVYLSLFGATFNTQTPDIGISVEGALLKIESMMVADDNKSVLLDMNTTSGCKDINITFTIEYNSLNGEDSIPLQSNKMPYRNPMVICTQNSDISEPILEPINQLPVAIIGTDYSDDGEQNIEVLVGEIVTGLESSYSYDMDPYPFGGITHCMWQDPAGAIIKESNDLSCDLNDLSFDTAGTYVYTLSVTDNKDATDTNIANIIVLEPEVPEVVITLEDTNISVVVKGETNSVQTSGLSDVLDVAYTDPKHGEVTYFKIGNEVPAFTYKSTDCFVGKDSFVYKSGDDYGRVNVTITAPTSLSSANNIATSIFNTEVISGEYLRANSTSIGIEITQDATGGSSSLTIIGNEIVNYNYDPDDGFVGDDYFLYTLSETIDGCLYNDIGRVDIEVKAPLPKVHLFDWYDDVHGYEIWRTDGTVAGTTMVKDIWAGTNGGGSVGSVVLMKDIYYFAANDGVNGTELWRTDGTESGTYMVKDINPGVDDGSFPSSFSLIGDSFYFFGMSGDNNGSNWKGSKGLWKSDGTGTQLIEDFGDYSLTSYGAPGYLQPFGDRLIFAKDDGAGGGYQWEPWISDGSSSAYKLKDIWSGEDGSSFIGCLELNSKCYATADDYYHGAELWVTDGTESGTHIVKDIYEDDGTGRGTDGGASNLTIVGNQLFFVSNSLSNGFALWKSDGTLSGTVMVKDSFLDDTGTSYTHRYNYSDFTDVNGMLYFVFNDEANGQELWKSDGTSSGTVMVKDMGSDNYSAPSYLVEMDGTLYFWFTDNTTPANSGLYKTDGTSTGTQLVKAFSSDTYEVSGSEGIVEDNGKLYVVLFNYDNSNTQEYWVSDGTLTGTFKLVDGESYGEAF